MGYIRHSPNHGVNPAIPLCFFCGKEKNEIILCGRIGMGDVEAPQKAVWDQVPCDKCAELMKKGVILIVVRDGESGNNPHRTGQQFVLTDDAIRRLVISSKLADEILRKRMTYIEEKVARTLGLYDMKPTEGYINE